MKFSKWFDLDVSVSNTRKQAATVVSWSLLFLHEQTKYLEKGHMKFRLLLRLLECILLHSICEESSKCSLKRGTS